MNAMRIEIGKQYKSPQKIVTIVNVIVQADENGKPQIVIDYQYDEGQIGGIEGLIRTAERTFDDFVSYFEAV